MFGFALSAFAAACNVNVGDEPECLEQCTATHLDCQGACSSDGCRATCDLRRGQCENTCEGTADDGKSASPNEPNTDAGAHDAAMAGAPEAAADCRTPCEERHTRCAGHCSGTCTIKCAGAAALRICVANCHDHTCPFDCEWTCAADCTVSCDGDCDTQKATCTRECT